MPGTGERKSFFFEDKKFKKIPPEEPLFLNKEKRIPYGWIFLLSLFAGLAGGIGAFTFLQNLPAESALPQTQEVLVLKDASGIARAYLQTRPDGTISLSWNADASGSRLILEPGDQGVPRLLLYDASGHPVLVLGRQQDGNTGLFLSGGRLPGAELMLSPDGDPSLVLNRDRPKTEVRLAVNGEGTRGLFFYNDSTNPAASLTQTGSERPVILPAAFPEAEPLSDFPAPQESLPPYSGKGQKILVPKTSVRDPSKIQRIETLKGVYSETIEHCEGGVVC